MTAWPRVMEIDHENWERMPSGEFEIKHKNISEPMIYVGVQQKEVVKNERNGIVLADSVHLPCWIPATRVADYFNKSHMGVKNAVARLRGSPYMWATEFENVHDFWMFSEPSIEMDGKRYYCNEIYYQLHKPSHDDMSHHGNEHRIRVMRAGLVQKFFYSEQSDVLLNLLVSTFPVTLLSLKPDDYWGVNENGHGSNTLAILLMELRAEAVSAMKLQLKTTNCDLMHPAAVPKNVLTNDTSGNAQIARQILIDQLWSCYDEYFAPSGWVRDEFVNDHNTYNENANSVMCLSMWSGSEEDLTIVVRQREPTNIMNQEGLYNSQKLVEHFKYEKSGYKTLFDKNKQKELPPNFALLCKTKVRGTGVFETDPVTINVVNAIGFAFDDESQPDYIYFVQNERMSMFPRHLEEVFQNIFAAFVSSGCDTLLLCEFGAGAFATHFPGGVRAYLLEYFYPCLQKIYKSLQDHHKPVVIGLVGNPQPENVQLLQNACPDVLVFGCGLFPDIVTESLHVRTPRCTAQHKIVRCGELWPSDEEQIFPLRNALFVNAWDPHSIVGNGNHGDNSLDGFIGRCTAMAPLSFWPTNPCMKIINTKWILSSGTT